MSRVGIKPISIPNNVKVEIKNNLVSVEGPKGRLTKEFSHLVEIKKENSNVVVKRTSDEKIVKSLHGTTRSIISNMVKGAEEGFQKELEIIGVGYSAKIEGKKLILRLGFSYPIEYIAPDGIEIEVKKEKNFSIVIKGVDKQKVGEEAYKIRSLYPPNCYKGNGIRYKGEEVKLKQGKATATGASTT